MSDPMRIYVREIRENLPDLDPDEAIVPDPITGKALIQWSDFSFLGVYTLPQNGISNPYGGDFGFTSGLTHRYVGSETQPRLYIANFQAGTMQELRPTGDPSAPTPAVLEFLGSIQPVSSDPTGQGNAANGVHWSERDKRLYYGSDVSGWYDASDAPKWGFSTLSDTTPSVRTLAGTGNPEDIWAIASWTQDMPNQPARYGQRWLWGCQDIPQWFADLYLGGRRIACGWGGSRSQTATGPTHHGPALFAAHPIDLVRDRQEQFFSQMPYPQSPAYHGWKYAGGLLPLMGAPYQHAVWPGMLKAHGGVDWYEAGYTSAEAVKNYHHNIGNFNAVWIDTPTKHGVLYSTMELIDNQNWANNTPAFCAHLDGDHAAFSTTLRIREGGCLNQVFTNGRGLRPDDGLFIQTDHNAADPQPVVGDPATYPGSGRRGGNGSWGEPAHPVPGGSPPYGECAIVTGIIDDYTITVRHTNRFGHDFGPYGIFSFGADGAEVRMGYNYWDAGGPSCRRIPTMYCYDPTRFAEVAQGTRAWTNVPWAWYADTWSTPSAMPYMDPVCGVGEVNMACQYGWAGMTFDSRTNRLYCLRGHTTRHGGSIVFPWWTNLGIWVFQLNV